MVYKTERTVTQRPFERTYNIDLSEADKKHLRSLMVQELYYYNTLITALNSKLRVLYTEIINLKGAYERIWTNVAQTGIDLRQLVQKQVAEWPEIFKPYAEQIAKNNRLLISDRMMMLMDIAATRADIHPQIRRLIAIEIFKNIQPQAHQIEELHSNVSGQMKNPIQMLQPKDFEFKRHIQLTKELSIIKYDKDTESSFVTIPYIETPIKVEGYDLVKSQFNHITIRQRPGAPPAADTPWQLTVREDSNQYLLNQTDMSYVARNKHKSR